MLRHRLGRYSGSDVTPNTGNKQENVETIALGTRLARKVATDETLTV